MAGSSEKRLTELRRDRIGLVFESFNLIDDLTVAENIEASLFYRGVSGGERKRRVAEAPGPNRPARSGTRSDWTQPAQCAVLVA